jgi:hypothetical protein
MTARARARARSVFPLTSVRTAWALRGLAGLALSDRAGFTAQLERRSGRPVRLEAVSLQPEAPSGLCLRTADADYLYYEEQTSPFHQAHILTGLAAHLLAESPTAGPDLRLAGPVSPRLTHLMLGASEGHPLSQDQAETLTFHAMGRAGVTACRASLARWFLRQIQPLHLALLEAAPEAAARPCTFSHPSPRRRLYRQVIEIRDAMLGLRPYRDQRVVEAAQVAARSVGLRCQALAASAEATVLAAAIAAKQSGALPAARPDIVWEPAAIARDLRGEAGWLSKVSREFARPLPLDQPRSIQLLGDSPYARDLVRGIRPATDRSGACLDGHLTPREAKQLRRRGDWRSQS